MAQTIKVSQRDATQPIRMGSDVKFLRGDDGFSPTVEVAEAEGGFIITVTDAEGEKTFFLPSGSAITDEQVQEAVNAYLSENPVEETDPTVPAWAKAETKPTYTAEEIGALKESALSEAVNAALAQAKASGEFDGSDGKQGPQGERGEKGEKGDTGPAGEVDYTKVAEYEASAKEAAEQAASSASSASNSASTASGKASDAATSATNAANSATAAANSASEATSQRETVYALANDAKAYRDSAENYKNVAAEQADNVDIKAAEAESSAQFAKTYATNAANDATNADNRAKAAASSASAAAGSATTASDKATAAANSASAAKTSETNAASSAKNASDSETAASSSASAASKSATTASDKATAAANSASAAKTSETNAASSASTATSKASAASTSATNAANSASTASSKATAASTSATNAANSATAAAASAARVEEVASSIGFYEVPDYWQNAVNTAIEKVKAIQDEGGAECVQFAAIGDLHWVARSTGNYGGNVGNIAAAVMDACDIPLFVALGDLAESGCASTEQQLLDDHEAVMEVLSPIGNDRLMAVRGNHDDVWGTSTESGTTIYYVNKIDQAKIWNRMHRGQMQDFRRVAGGDGTYFYIDNEPQSTRFICLNTHFYDGDAITAGTAKMMTTGFGTEQLNWLRDVALNVKSGWTVVIFQHVPPNPSYMSQLSDGATFKSIIESASAEIAAVFCGHCHADTLVTDYLPCPVCSVTVAANIPYDSNEEARTLGTDKETAVDFISINKKTRVVKTVRLGVGSDRVFSYSGVEIVTYTVTNNLTNATTSNGSTVAESGTAYSATISAADGCENLTVTVTMGGVDITSSAYSGGVVSIASVTGNIIITASAEKKAAYTNLADPTSTDWKTDTRLGSDGTYQTGATGYITTNWFECKRGDVLRIKGLNLEAPTASTAYFQPEFENGEKPVMDMDNTYKTALTKANDIYTYTVLEGDASGTQFVTSSGDVVRMRMCGVLTATDSSGVIITKNEEIEDSGSVSYTNLFDPSKATLNARISSSGTPTWNGMFVSDFIPVSGLTRNSDIFYFKGENVYGGTLGGGCYIAYYNSSKTMLDRELFAANVSHSTVEIHNGSDGSYYFYPLTSTTKGAGVTQENVAYVRFGLGTNNTRDTETAGTAITVDDIADVVITLNEPIE